MHNIELKQVKYYKVCPVCGYEHQIILKDITEQQRINYKFNVIPIQVNFQHLNKTELEFLKSGTCTKCQRQLFDKKSSSKKIRIVY